MVGIYKITSPTGKIYIGQSVDIEKRWYQYSCSYRASIGRKLYNSLIKYGWDNHQKEVLEECDINLLDEREVYHKTKVLENCMYNFSTVLFCELYDKGGGKRSDNTRANISKAKMGHLVSEETKLKISLAKKGRVSNNKGKKLSKEAREKMSERMKGSIPWNKGLVYTEEQKQRLQPMWDVKRTGASHPRSKAILDTETGIEYASVAECKKALNKAGDTIYRLIRIKRLQYVNK